MKIGFPGKLILSERIGFPEDLFSYWESVFPENLSLYTGCLTVSDITLIAYIFGIC